MSAHQAWALVCRLFAGGTPVFRSALSPAELRACAALGSAIKPTVANRTFALCPYCQLRSGQIFSNGQGGQICHCPDCGPVPLAPDDRTALELDESWLRSKLRTALGIESRDSVVDLDDGVWRLGAARRDPVLLARNLNRLWANQSLFDRVRVPGGNTRVIAPRTSQLRGSPFPAGTEWLPLEERFMLYGGRGRRTINACVIVEHEPGAGASPNGGTIQVCMAPGQAPALHVNTEKASTRMTTTPT